MKNGIAHWLLLLLSLAAALLAAELNTEILEKLDFFLNYGIAEHLELLEQAELPPLPSSGTAQAAAAARGFPVQASTQAAHISSQTLHVSSAALNGGVK